MVLIDTAHFRALFTFFLLVTEAVSQTKALGCHCFQVRCRIPCVIWCFSPFMHKKYFAERSRKKLRSDYMQKCHSPKMDGQVSSAVSSVTQSCPTLCDSMDCSMPGLPVHHQLPELTETHVHWVGDAIQPSHPLSSPSPALNLSQHQGLSQWISSSHQLIYLNLKSNE